MLPGMADSIKDLTTQILAFRDARDWSQFHAGKNERRYPVEKARGSNKKYNEL